MLPQDTCTQTPLRSSRWRMGARRRLDIDGLRLVVCVAVVVNHMDKSWMPGGFTGVDVFFVISGYVVTLASVRTNDSILAFYARRIRRLMPLSTLVLVIIYRGLCQPIPADRRGEPDANYTCCPSIGRDTH